MPNTEVKKIFVGDIGKIIKVFAGADVDISTANLIVLKVKKPSGSTVSWTGHVDPTNKHYALYTTQEDDIDIAGTWLVSLEVTFPDASYHKGGTGSFPVYTQFEDTGSACR